MKKLYIKQWAFINDKEANLNGATQIEFDKALAVDAKLEATYRVLNFAYPKFFKMDAQSKLGWLCTEYVSDFGKQFELNSKEEIAVVLSNAKSSLDTDSNYQESLYNKEEFLPSPAVFVYTLSNIVTGEICIRHGLKGENNFFISEEFDANALVNYTNILFEEELCTKCLVGWVEAYKNKIHAMFVLVDSNQTENGEENLFTNNKLIQLYLKSKL